MYGYYKCRNCGQNLDPGEKCDCELESETNTDNSEQISNIRDES
jgi:hypothetical protein